MSGDSENGITMKKCPDCQTEKLSTAFSRNACRPDGLQFYCKECYSARAARTYRERQKRKGRTVRERFDVPAGLKRCPGCGEIKPRSQWHKNARTYDGLASRCKPCRKLESRDAHLRRTFGITAADYDELVQNQGGGCAICGGSPKHVDHDHESGQVRGVLCGPCNMGLGQFRDSPDLLHAAVRYLRKNPGRHWAPVIDLFPRGSPFEVALRRHLA